MKSTQSQGDGPVHQTVAGGVEFKTGGKTIAVEFTDQRLSPHAGSATFWGWLRPSGWVERLAAALPHPAPCSNNHLTPLAKALAFCHGLLCEARKLTHVAYLRRDPLVPELLGIRRVASQSSLSRFFAGFASPGGNLRCFRGLWQWGMARLPSRKEGYTLDLDSTRLLHEDGHQQGVAVGYTRQGLKPCLHPLLAVLAEVRLVAQLWLRAGNTACANNVAAFILDLWQNLPSHLRLRAVRADSGFCTPELLALWESLGLPYVVVAQLCEPIKNLLRRGLVWQASEVHGTEVAEIEYRAARWPHPRRLVLIRHRVSEPGDRGGKRLLDVPGYRFQVRQEPMPAGSESGSPPVLESARRELALAVSGLRRSGNVDDLPRGLLTRAWLRSLTGPADATGSPQAGPPQGGARTGPSAGSGQAPQSAQGDLDEAWEIAERGPMPLFMADIHLYRARLFGTRSAEGGTRKEEAAPYPWNTNADGSPRGAVDDLAEARRLIVKHGYLRRMPELEDAEAWLRS